MSTNEQLYRDNSELNYRIGLEVIEKLNLQAGETILDVGCGDGR